MEIPKPTDADRARFLDAVPDDPRVEVRPMFGNLGAFVNGNMFMGLFGSDIGVKLDDAGSDELRKTPGAGPFGPDGRPMGGYTSFPASWRQTPATMTPWVARSLTTVAALPPKAKKPKKKPGPKAPR